MLDVVGGSEVFVCATAGFPFTRSVVKSFIEVDGRNAPSPSY